MRPSYELVTLIQRFSSHDVYAFGSLFMNYWPPKKLGLDVKFEIVVYKFLLGHIHFNISNVYKNNICVVHIEFLGTFLYVVM